MPWTLIYNPPVLEGDPLPEHDRMGQPHHVLSSNSIRNQAIAVFDWQGDPCQVCVSILETESTTFRILKL